GHTGLSLPLAGAPTDWTSYSLATLSGDGRWLAVANERPGSEGENTVLIYDAARGTLVRTLAHESEVYSLAWHPDSTALAVSLWESNQNYLWDCPSGKRIGVLRGQRGGQPFLQISPSGQLLAAQSFWAV